MNIVRAPRRHLCYIALPSSGPPNLEKSWLPREGLSNSKSSHVSRKDDVIRFASKVEYHQRQLVDPSDPAYTQRSYKNQEFHQRKLVDSSDPAISTRPSRLDLNYPLTAVSGIN